jgi:hypothetical protein
MYVGKEGKGGLPVRMPRKRRKKKRPKRGRTLHVVQIVLLLAALFILTKYVSFVRVVVQDADPGGMKKGSLPERPYSNAVPIAIFAGRKDKSYITSLWKSIAQAVTFAEGSKRVCFILDDSGSRISKSYFSDYTRIACSEVVVVSSASIGGLENGADSSEKGMRLKEVWRAMLTKIWSSSFLSDYDGDVLFLEDDLVLAKDFLFALNFLLKVKNDHTESNEFAQDVSLVALGGWVSALLLPTFFSPFNAQDNIESNNANLSRLERTRGARTKSVPCPSVSWSTRRRRFLPWYVH